MKKILIAFVAGAALASGVTVLARTDGAASLHAMVMGGHDANAAQNHADRMLQHLYVDLQATDAQKAQIDPLVKQAVTEIQALQSQQAAVHAQVVQALTQSPVDRAALETARAAHIQAADQATRRLMQLVADVGDLLTAEQRKILAEQLQRLHGI
ncbi:MAG TPA: Spy/CpxP family protein refolding chaperone [Steroidobacteraceae bacterium]|jgi:Spy/CpxP family protein refolding chaperone